MNKNNIAKTNCKHGVPYRYDCEYCREGIEPYNCKHGIDSQLGCPDCKNESLSGSVFLGSVSKVQKQVKCRK